MKRAQGAGGGSCDEGGGGAQFVVSPLRKEQKRVGSSGCRDSSDSSSDDAGVDQEAEAEAAVALARFWRHNSAAPAQAAQAAAQTAMSSSSRIAVIAQSAGGRKFLQLRVAKLQRLAAAPSRRQAALLHALASALSYLGDVRRALQASAQAVLLAPRKRNYKWMHLKLGRHAAAQAAAAASWPAACPLGCHFRAVQRVSCSHLTCNQFFQEFAMAQRPVIITGLQVTREAWTLDVIEQAAAQASVEVKTVRAGSCEWAGLEVERATTVAQFVRSVKRCGDDQSGCGERGYLFDWSLPQVGRARARAPLRCCSSPDQALPTTVPTRFAALPCPRIPAHHSSILRPRPSAKAA